MQEPENLNENPQPIVNPQPSSQPMTQLNAREKSRPGFAANFGSSCLMLIAFWFPLPHFSPLLKFVLLGVCAAVIAQKSNSPLMKSAAKSALWTWSFLALMGALGAIYLRGGRFP